MSASKSNLETSTSFPHLANAPIVEAVIHWRTDGTSEFDEAALSEDLAARLPDYPHRKPQHEFRFEAKVGQQGNSTNTHRRWRGIRVESGDGRYVAQFLGADLVCSRLRPYNNWDAFSSEAIKIWGVFKDLAHPTQIQRIGVRYINQIDILGAGTLGRLLRSVPKPLPKLTYPISRFMYQSVQSIPGTIYEVELIRTIAPKHNEKSEAALIVDIDVYTTESFLVDDQRMHTVLAEMRHIKNTFWFSLLKPKAIHQFQGAGI